MKKYIFTILFALVASVSFAQMPMMRHQPKDFKMTHVDMSQYEVLDSLPLEKITIYSPYDYGDEDVINLGSGLYLIDIPHKDKMIIRTNKERTKAIVVYNSYCFGRHKEFNIKETEKRIVLWYEDDDVYCGYQYDKKYKVCKYFENWWEEIK
jgi:hypothetical protein